MQFTFEGSKVGHDFLLTLINKHKIYQMKALYVVGALINTFTLIGKSEINS